MNSEFSTAMRQALRATRSQNVMEGTRIIQDALTGTATRPVARHTAPEFTSPAAKRGRHSSPIDRNAQILEPLRALETTTKTRKPAESTTASARRGKNRLMSGLAEALAGLGPALPELGVSNRLPGLRTPTFETPGPPIPGGAQFLTRSYSCAAGTRSYRLYVPSCAADNLRGFVVMLHGCRQGPEDFAVGTKMNTVAEANRLLIAYPAQPVSANMTGCWNWFDPAHQMRDSGEPAIIAGLTRQIATEFGIGSHRVFVAGLSAGGAMAAVMGQIYPDLYAAIGVHSGLAYGSARDIASAFSAMRGQTGHHQQQNSQVQNDPDCAPRIIVFHGTADRMVHASNAERIVAAAYGDDRPVTLRSERDVSDGGRSYTRTVMEASNGTACVEYWLIDGAGHAWSGGHPGGSYTDPDGPDASNEMVRFFLN